MHDVFALEHPNSRQRFRKPLYRMRGLLDELDQFTFKAIRAEAL
jgi:hypothetical protein